MKIVPDNIDTMSPAEGFRHIVFMALSINAVSLPNTAGIIALGMLLEGGHPPAVKLTAAALLAIAVAIDICLFYRYKPQLKRLWQALRQRD